MPTTDAVPLEQFGRVLLEVEADFRNADLEPALHDCADILRESHRQIFDSQSAPDGSPWEPWHWRRPEASDSHPTLRDTGALLASVVGGADHIENISARDLEFGTSKKYAGIHQSGASFTTGIGLVGRGGVGFIPAGTRITVPARPFVGVNDKALDAMVNTIADAVVEALKR